MPIGIDLTFDRDEPRRARRVLEAGAGLRGRAAALRTTYDGHHVTMADPEGNEFCVA
jgi:hypothetical protein